MDDYIKREAAMDIFGDVPMGHDMCAKNVKLLGRREVGLCATGKDDFCNYGERKKR